MPPLVCNVDVEEDVVLVMLFQLLRVDADVGVARPCDHSSPYLAQELELRDVVGGPRHLVVLENRPQGGLSVLRCPLPAELK